MPLILQKRRSQYSLIIFPPTKIFFRNPFPGNAVIDYSVRVIQDLFTCIEHSPDKFGIFPCKKSLCASSKIYVEYAISLENFRLNTKVCSPNSRRLQVKRLIPMI